MALRDEFNERPRNVPSDFWHWQDVVNPYAVSDESPNGIAQLPCNGGYSFAFLTIKPDRLDRARYSGLYPGFHVIKTSPQNIRGTPIVDNHVGNVMLTQRGERSVDIFVATARAAFLYNVGDEWASGIGVDVGRNGFALEELTQWTGQGFSVAVAKNRKARGDARFADHASIHDTSPCTRAPVDKRRSAL